MAKLTLEKAGWIKTVLPTWDKMAKEREMKMAPPLHNN